MKRTFLRLFLFVFLGGMPFMASSQDLRCTYCFFKTRPDGKIEANMDMLLDLAEGKSAFYSETTFLRDSLRVKAFDSGGNIKDYDSYKRLTALPGYATKDFTCVDYHSGVFVQRYDDIVIVSGTGELEKPGWVLKDEFLEVFGFRCRRAEANYFGRNWIVWFSEDIPCSAGPWLLYGAPGLILLAEDSERLIQFRMNGMQKLTDNSRASFLSDFYDFLCPKVSRYKYDIRKCETFHTDFMSDPAVFDKVAGGRTTSIVDAKGNHISMSSMFSYTPIIPDEYWR